MTITVSTADKRDGKALALFAKWDTWQQGHTKDGRSFWAIPGSQPNLFHMADCKECSCPDFQRYRNICKHVRACRLWMAAFRTGAVSLKREAVATADDVAVLTPEGAAYLAGLDSPVSPTVDTSSDGSYLQQLTREQQSLSRLLCSQGINPETDASYIEYGNVISRLQTPVGHADCVANEQTHAALTSLRAAQTEHVRTLRVLGYAPDEYFESGVYRQCAEQIARLEACLAHEVVAV